MTSIESVNSTQTTNIAATDGKMQNAYAQANSFVDGANSSINLTGVTSINSVWPNALSLTAAAATAGNATGKGINITAGRGFGASDGPGGPVNITAGAGGIGAGGGLGGLVTITAGAGGDLGGNGGDLRLRSGNPGSGGLNSSIELIGGLRTGAGGGIAVTGGQASGANKDGGVVTISAGISTGSSSASAVEFYTTPAGASSSTAGTSTKRLEILSTGQVKALASITSTSTTTGTLVVTGGVGISENLYVGGTTNISSTLSVGGASSGTIELGTDGATTLARSGAGVVTIEGVEIVTLSRSQTLTNKTLTSPTLTTPSLGVATATSINGLTISTSTGTLTVTNGKTLSISNTLTFTGTDSSSVAFGAGGTVLYSGGALGTPSSGSLTNCSFPTLNQNTTGSAATLTTARAIYGNNFDGSAALSGIIASTYGGTGNGFTKFSGPASTERTFTLPNATATILTDNATVTVAQGGTGQITLQAAINSLAGATTSTYYLRGNGTNVVMSAIQAGDIPTLNQSTTGSSASCTGNAATASNPSGGGTFITSLNIGSQSVSSATSATSATTATTANALATGNNYQVNSIGIGTAASGTAGEIRATNNITAYYSDDRLKTRLGAITEALSKVQQLNGFYYEANQTAQDLGYKVRREVGVSAQDVQKIMPEIVSPAPIDAKYLTIDYERLVPLLIEAIKELKAEVDELKKK